MAADDPVVLYRSVLTRPGLVVVLGGGNAEAGLRIRTWPTVRRRWSCSARVTSPDAGASISTRSCRVSI